MISQPKGTFQSCEIHFVSRNETNDTAKNNTNSTNFSDKNSFKINLISIEGNSMTNKNFDMTTSVETNYHIASDEIDRIFDGNAIHCNEVKHSTSDDS